MNWQGLTLLTPLGHWNAPMIMAIIGAVWVVPLVILLLLYGLVLSVGVFFPGQVF